MKRPWWQYALAALAALLALWLLVAILSFRPPDAELARTVREPLRMARQAYESADAAPSLAVEVLADRRLPDVTFVGDLDLGALAVEVQGDHLLLARRQVAMHDPADDGNDLGNGPVPVHVLLALVAAVVPPCQVVGQVPPVPLAQLHFPQVRAFPGHLAPDDP